MFSRTILSILLAGSVVAAASGQITLDRGNYPFPLGTGTITSFEVDNEDGASTAALEAIIAQSGSDQTYDFTALQYDFEVEGTYTVEAGATGPVSGVEPFSSATHTTIFPVRTVIEEEPVEVTMHLYTVVTDEQLLDLGGHMEGEVDGMPFEMTLTRSPDGDRTAAFPYTMGDSWTSSFSETAAFQGFEIMSDVAATYTVDGWGTFMGPGVEGGVPALRVRVEESRSTFGVSITSVCYEFRSTAPVQGMVCEGGTGQPPTGQFSVVAGGATAAEPELPGLVAALDPIYPNPVRGAARADYRLQRAALAELTIHDVLGREVRQLNSGWRVPGSYSETLDVSGLAPGIYILRLEVNGQSWARAFSLLP